MTAFAFLIVNLKNSLK